MKKITMILLSTFALAWLPTKAAENTSSEAADSVEMLSYAQIDGTTGMLLAWRADDAQAWQQIGNTSFVNSDFGPWGSHKKMFAPYLCKPSEGEWTLTWIADPEEGLLATATSSDLVYWRPQTYAMTTSDRSGISQYIVDEKPVLGNVNKVPRALVDDLQAYTSARQAKAQLYAEVMADDATRFADLQPIQYTMTAQPGQSKNISDMLIGIFIEDINYAADGGMYAELIQNRDFEYQPSDRGGDKKWNSLTAWKETKGKSGNINILTHNPVHVNNPHYLRLQADEEGYGVSNSGYDGIPVKEGAKYDFSIMARGNAKANVSIVAANGNVLASAPLNINGDKWTTYTAVLTPTANADKASLLLTLDTCATIDIDMVSLFPQETFKGRKNGLRPDLAQTLADMHPRFIRFPGGCVAHGDGIDNIYDWKGSVGPLEARKPLRNLWGYHQTRGLGYYEYFQFCEDIGAEPLPVLAAGVPCQNSGVAAHHSHDALTTKGQQCGIPMEEMDEYIQDILDLIEWANGPADSKWGKVRAEAGHPEPFNLKYIGIGNEDMITEVFEERFRMIYDVVSKAHPEVKIVGTVGPFYEGTDYTEGWRLARELSIPLVDEHYYVQPGWMIYNQDFYDSYARGENATKVYLGEYAAHLPNRASTLETALAEALYLTSVERNGDVVEMTSYAPLFSKDGHTQWRPDLIYFSNTDVRPSVDYYVQVLYGQNSGTQYIPSEITTSSSDEKVNVRIGSSIVYDPATKEYVLKLANLLPTTVDVTADISKLKINKKHQPSAVQISGNPTDQDLKPTPIEVSKPKGGKLSIELPPYSFTVIRL